MYLPAQFASDDRGHAAALMRAHPFATLIGTDDDGFPYVTHLPLHLREGAGGALTLLGHCARANAHWRHLQARPEALAVFHGPHAYLSPSVYADAQRVPSWNYLAVHCRVRAALVQDDAGKQAILALQIADHESAYLAQWQAQAPDFQRRMLAGIVGFELQVLDLQCKLKLNQHRPESHAAMHAQYGAGTPDERALAEWMQRLGMAARE